MYDGETPAETLARVIERESDMEALPSSTPQSIRSLIRRCLTKDPRSRLQAIGEARIAIEEALAHPQTLAPTVTSSSTNPGGPWKAYAPLGARRRARRRTRSGRRDLGTVAAHGVVSRDSHER
jgi:serine/threonine protein kinase